MKKSLLLFCLISSFLFSKEQKKEYKYSLSICCIFKDDSNYLPEWIEFHYSQGVDHFYLFNNLSRDDYMGHLQPYINQGIVDLIEWPLEAACLYHWNQIQCNAYMHGLREYKDESKWIAYIDNDEFLFSPTGENLKQVLKRYEGFAGVCANWVVFGTSNIERILPHEKMLEKLVMRCPINDQVNKHVKSIVRPKYVQACPNPHFFLYKENYHAVTENKDYIDGPFSEYVSVNFLRINHYWTRDLYFFYNYKLPQRLNIQTAMKREDWINIEKNLNQEYDDLILNLCPQKT